MPLPPRSICRRASSIASAGWRGSSVRPSCSWRIASSGRFASISTPTSVWRAASCVGSIFSAPSSAATVSFVRPSCRLASARRYSLSARWAAVSCRPCAACFAFGAGSSCAAARAAASMAAERFFGLVPRPARICAIARRAARASALSGSIGVTSCVRAAASAAGLAARSARSARRAAASRSLRSAARRSRSARRSARVSGRPASPSAS